MKNLNHEPLQSILDPYDDQIKDQLSYEFSLTWDRENDVSALAEGLSGCHGPWRKLWEEPDLIADG